MISKNTISTIISKFIVLLTNFVLVVFTTQIWGSEGRGEIALVFVNISIIAIFSNIFCGSAVAYHVPRQQRDFLLSIAFMGGLLISLAGAIILSVVFRLGHFWPVFLIAFFLSLTTTISVFWLGKNNILKYNLITLLSPIFILFSLASFYFIFNQPNLDVYFHAYYLGIAIVLIIGIADLLWNDPFKLPSINVAGLKSIFNYGIKNELNYLIQFLNYRLSYYFIAKFLGLGQLGIFSIVVSISEAVWFISMSMSAIHFSNVINSDNQLKDRQETMVFVRQSFCISLIFLGISVLIPDSVYQIIFGNEFGDVRKFIIYLVPGILAIAVSNLYGHYFAGKGKLKILRNKSLIGLAATLIILPLLIKKYQLTGVCISLNVSYILSSLYLWICFRKEEKLT